ncbi:hypothetical protein NMY22_g15421 [Coprinellus aureogranulatus]|nr:hypothetical protein NMY22_g15421 [Coprinellus aureogranulatus]
MQVEAETGVKRVKLELVHARFISRPAIWESQRLRDFKAYLDSKPDNCKGSNQSYVRIPGKRKEKEIPKTTTFNGHTRHWMIDWTWWQKTGKAKYDDPHRVAANGFAWGEEEDPEEDEKKVKALAAEKKEMAGRRKATKRQREGDAAGPSSLKKAKGKKA